MSEPSRAARDFTWLLDGFAADTPGVLYAIAVSTDGILIAASEGLERSTAEQMAAIISGLTSLALGADRCFDAQGVDQIIVEFGRGFLFVTAMGAGASLGVLSDKESEIGLVAYEMTLLIGRAGRVLSPELVAELKNLLTV